MTPAQFKIIRLDLGPSQKEMARALGITTARAIRYYEKGERPISGCIEKLMLIYRDNPLLLNNET